MKSAALLIVALTASIPFFTGCREARRPSTEMSGGGHGHHHEPPHGGTGVELGEEDAHVEFVRDAATGKMTAYILAPHMADFLRLEAKSFEVTAKVAGKEETLVFNAVASSATGETVGNTAQFEAQADWLKTATTFDGVLKEITIRGKTFTKVAFNFPKGNQEH